MAIKDQLVAVWELNEASGDAIDVHSTLDLTDTNTVGASATAPSALSGSRDFEATNSEYFTLADAAALSCSTDTGIYVTAWVNFESKPSGAAIFGKGNTNASAQVEYFLLYEGGGTDRFRFYVGNGSTFQAVSANSLGSPSTSTWYFVEAWHDPAANQIGIRVNRGTATTASWSSGTWDGTRSSNIGRDPDLGYYFDGLIAQVALWFDRMVDSGDLDTIYASGNGYPYSSWDAAGGTTHTKTYTESLGHVDAYARVSTANRDVDESCGLANAFARLSNANRAISDTAGASDAVARVATANRNLTDVTGLAEAFARLSNANRATTDTVGVTDASARTSTANRATTDTLGVADAFARIAHAFRDFDDVLGLADAVTVVHVPFGAFALYVAEALGASDSYARRADAARGLTESCGLIDAYARVSHANRAYTDVLGLAQAVSVVIAGGIVIGTVAALGIGPLYIFPDV